MSDEDQYDDDDEFLSSAADDPTAVWDAAALEGLGLGSEDDRARSGGPATAPDVGGQDHARVLVAKDEAEAKRGPTSPPARRGGLSWPVTIVAALALGAAVFFLVRLLR